MRCQQRPFNTRVGLEEGLQHDSGIHCDELVSLPKSMLSDYVGMLQKDKLRLLERALRVALRFGEG